MLLFGNGFLLGCWRGFCVLLRVGSREASYSKIGVSFINSGSSEQLVRALKTVIGSFPLKRLPIQEAIQWAVDLQLAHDLDVVSDGEQRTDMIGYFKSLPGLGTKAAGPYVKSKIMPFEEPDSFDKLLDLRFVRNYLKHMGREDVKVKVSITGPITLGFACACNGVEHYGGIRDMRLYSDFASALKPLVESVAKAECYVQVDEPSLSIRVMEASEAIKIVNTTLSGVPDSIYDAEKLIVHVCGSLTRSLFEDLASLEAPVLSLAFSSPSVKDNVEAISKLSLQSHRKKLGVGCVSVQARTKEEVDTVESTFHRLKVIRDKIGTERIAFLHPDCGLRGTGENALGPILERVSESAFYLEKQE
jgi:methionine synthase II (cobalamin-independent)